MSTKEEWKLPLTDEECMTMVKAWDAYLRPGRTEEDAEDLSRILKRMGVLHQRLGRCITPSPT